MADYGLRPNPPYDSVGASFLSRPGEPRIHRARKNMPAPL